MDLGVLLALTLALTLATVCLCWLCGLLRYRLLKSRARSTASKSTEATHTCSTPTPTVSVAAPTFHAFTGLPLDNKETVATAGSSPFVLSDGARLLSASRDASPDIKARRSGGHVHV